MNILVYGDIMLERYNDIQGLVKIPFTETAVDIDGNVYSELGNNVYTQINENNEPFVFANLWYGFQNYKVSEIIAFTFKNCYLPLERWREVTVLHIDGNPRNNHPSNLVWKFPKGGLFHHRYIEFAYIPGFSRYIINKEGDVLSLIGENFLTKSPSQGYYKYRIQPDNGISTHIGRHRLMAFAFLEYPANVDTLDVNHISGIRGDDRLENLEWATRQRNCQHAYENGLRNDNHEILVKNCLTGEIKEFYSYEDCARALNLDGQTIGLRVKAKGQPVYPGLFQFKRKNDPSPWREVLDPQKELYRSGVARKLKVRDIRTNEVTIYESAIKCGKALGFSKSTVLWQMRETRTKRPHRGYDFKWEDDETEWPNYTGQEIKSFLDNPVTLASNIIVTDTLTGEEKIYPNVSTFSKEIERADCTVHQFIRENKLIKNRYHVKRLSH